jgi:hypothetical protein
MQNLRMELRLVLRADCPLHRERQPDTAVEGGRQANLQGCFHLLLDGRDPLGILGIGIGGEALETTVQAELLDQPLDQRDPFLVGLP